MTKEEIYITLINTLKKSLNSDEVPVACIITNKNNEIVAKSINNRKNNYTVLGHAEINAIETAEKKIKDWRLNGYDMYVSLKPCEMCQKIIQEARIDNVYYLLDRKETNDLIDNMKQINNPQLASEYQIILRDFFKNKR